MFFTVLSRISVNTWRYPWLYGVASLRDLSVLNRDEPRGGEMQLVHTITLP